MAGSDWLASWPGALRDEPLARHSQYGIGGPADWFVRVSDTARLGELLRRCTESGTPVTVIGAGSNTLIRDGGIRGLVIKMTDRRLRVMEGDVVELSGGYLMPRAALDCAARGISGLEFGIGIPGTCGASVRGNAGAFGREMKDVVVQCDTLGPDGSAHAFSAGELGFAYRDSRFKHDLARHVVVAARFRTSQDDPAAVRARTDAIQASRKAAQPYGVRSLGSMFTNPPGDHAGRLVEAAGLKGRRIGGAEISSKHANFVVNAAGATAADVLALAELARRTVEERFGTRLELEIAVLGEAVRGPLP
jgi:UDP-N-acetylmuramate dehydrogenase